jgi:hypothetical protein
MVEDPAEAEARGLRLLRKISHVEVGWVFPETGSVTPTCTVAPLKLDQP